MAEERTGVHVHLDNAVLNSGLNLLLRGTGTTMENEEPVTTRLKKPLIGRSHTHKGLGDAPPNFSLTCFWCLPKSSG